MIFTCTNTFSHMQTQTYTCFHLGIKQILMGNLLHARHRMWILVYCAWLYREMVYWRRGSMYKLEDRWLGLWAQFPSCVNVAKLVRLRVFLFVLYKNLYAHLSRCGTRRGSWGQLAGPCPQRLSLKLAEAPWRQLCLSWSLSCWGISFHGDQVSSQGRPRPARGDLEARGIMRVCSRWGHKLELPLPTLTLSDVLSNGADVGILEFACLLQGLGPCLHLLRQTDRQMDISGR